MKTFKRERLLCTRGFVEELNAFFILKMRQIENEITKDSKKFCFLTFLCNFCLFFERIGSLHC